MLITKENIIKYDVSGPRYTSYPTAPEWSKDIGEKVYIEKLEQFSKTNKTLSIYFHLPFCRTLCTFCGCSVIIRRPDEKYGDEYLKYLFKEIELVARHLGPKPKVRQLHWGGGTPTFLTNKQIEKLFRKITQHFDIDLAGEVAIEIDPRTIDESKVKLLRSLGFNRVSMGVQDFDPQVQKAVNRFQPFEIVERFNQWCRELGFQSVNFDLIYGLPYQTMESFKDTIAKVVALQPDRIALYSFAYVPWLKKHQSKIDTETLPSTNTKIDIFLYSRTALLDAGYEAIAMDHFALKNDELATAFREGKLYRNFMGYTVRPADEYIGFGVTSIGFLEDTFIQNFKALPDYYAALDKNMIPVERGKELSDDDRIRQWVINSFMCLFEVDKKAFKKKFVKDFDQYFHEEEGHIQKCVNDRLLRVQADRILVTDLGKLFIRNICMGFDWYLRQQGAHRKFSKTI